MSPIRNTDLLKILELFHQENDEDIAHSHGKGSRVQVWETVSLERYFH
jgi:hypothetical protein